MSIEDKVMDCIPLGHAGRLCTDIAKDLNMERKDVSKVLAKLVANGTLTKSGKTRATVYART